jgi:SAM-dependent methyltransferase
MDNNRPRSPRFEDLTETTGIPLSEEGAEMMSTRYRVAFGLGAGARVLELGCGAGQGLGRMARTARSVVGGDYSKALLASGRAHYGSRVPFVQLTAEALPFRAGAFDLVLFFEASYYVPNMDLAFRELTRVLAPGGTVLMVNANPERPDFIRSPHSVHYHTADELRAALSREGLAVTTEGAFPVDDADHGSRSALVGAALRLVRSGLEALGLVPRTLRGRARFKRLVYGRLREVPPELPEDFGRAHPRAAIQPGPARGHKVLYVTARKPAGA